MKRTLLLFACLVAIPVAASAQAPPDPGSGPPSLDSARDAGRSTRRAFDPALPLTMAFRRIGLAEALGASGRYLDSARTHYRDAYNAYQQKDERKAIAQARVAQDLASAALVGHSPTPRGLPVPPSPAPGRAGGEGIASAGVPGFEGGGRVRVAFEGPPDAFRGRGGRGVDVVELAEIQRRDSSAEVHQLVSDALAATSAAQRAALAGDTAGAERQNRIAVNLAAAARDLSFANAPAPSGPATRRPL
jgi:hypothetical protein